MVTASHNPPADNGYKVYLGTGAQIVPPADTEIAACIDEVDPCDVAAGGRRRSADRARSGASSSRPTSPPCPTVRLVPGGCRRAGRVHGDARRRRRHAARGVRTLPDWPAPAVVAEQQEPDGTFPTVSFPNPEEPGAMDLLLARAAASRRALSRSPTTPTPTASVRRSRRPTAAGGGSAATRSGGCSPITSCATPPATTGWWSPRSSRRRCSARMAAAHGVHYAETFTGFKWIGAHRARAPRAALRVRLRAGARLPGLPAPARQGRHHRRGDAGRGRRARRRRGRHPAGSARRDRRRRTAATSWPSGRCTWPPPMARRRRTPASDTADRGRGRRR